MSAADVLIRLHADDAQAIASTVVALAGDQHRSTTERAAWLALGNQLLRRLGEHR